jgi:hypothetical protein
MYWFGFFGMKNLLDTLLPELANGFIHGGRRDGLSCAKDPYALLFSESGGSANRAQHDPVPRTFQFKGIPCGQLQLVSYGLGQNHPPGLIYSQSGIHNGILPCHLALIMVSYP